MRTQTIGRFENAEDLITWLKAHNYEEVRRYSDGAILQGEEGYVIVSFPAEGVPDSVAMVSFVGYLSDEDFECTDKEEALEPMKYWEDVFWFDIKELAACTSEQDGKEEVGILMDRPTFLDIIF